MILIKRPIDWKQETQTITKIIITFNSQYCNKLGKPWALWNFHQDGTTEVSDQAEAGHLIRREF